MEPNDVKDLSDMYSLCKVRGTRTARAEGITCEIVTVQRVRHVEQFVYTTLVYGQILIYLLLVVKNS